MNGSTFHGGTALKIVYTLNCYVAINGISSWSKSTLRNFLPGTTEILFGGHRWEEDFFGDDDINLTITAGGSLYAPIFEFVIMRSGAYVRWQLSRYDYT